MNCRFTLNNYLFDLSTLPEHVARLGARRILLEAPQGMVQILPQLSRKIRRCVGVDGLDVAVRLEPSYGLCSLSIDLVEKGFFDLIIHIGHDFYPYPFCNPSCTSVGRLLGGKVVVVAGEYVVDERVLEALEERVYRIVRGRSVGIGYSAQHRILASRLAERLKARGVEVAGVKPVLGCYTAGLEKLNTDYYLVVAGGVFHALGVALALNDGGRVLRVDPYEVRVESINELYRRIISKRYWVIMQIRRARRLGVIAGLLPGQYRPGIISALGKLLQRHGVDYDVLYVERLTREYLDNLSPREYDGYIVTSCPRLAIEDLGDYWKPVATPGEAIVAFRGLNRYIFPW